MTEAETIEVTRFDAARALQTLAMRGRINLPAGKVAVFNHNDVQVMFDVVNDVDVVQRAHSKSNFYERDDLELMAKYFPANGVFADIGANVGNHSVFAGLIMGASKIIPFEPNPIAQEIFLANMVLNRMVDRVDFSFFTYGLSDRMDEGLAMRWNPNNLGGGRIVRSDAATGGVVVIRGDDAFSKLGHVDFLKIDVEGLEIQVLDGLRDTVASQRPNIFIEIDNRNADAFFAWVEANGYHVAERIRNYAVNENFMIVPQERK